MGAGICLLLIHVLEGGFAAQTDLSGIVDVDDFDRDEVSFVADVGDFRHTVICHLGDVQKSIHSRKDLDKCSEVTDGGNFSALDLADFRLSGRGDHALFRSIELLKVGRHDLDGSVLGNVD